MGEMSPALVTPERQGRDHTAARGAPARFVPVCWRRVVRSRALEGEQAERPTCRLRTVPFPSAWSSTRRGCRPHRLVARATGASRRRGERARQSRTPSPLSRGGLSRLLSIAASFAVHILASGWTESRACHLPLYRKL